MTKFFAVLLLALSSAFSSTLLAESKFVHTDGRNLVSPDGTPLHLKGTNLGNWLEQEGYMFHFDDGGPASPREIEDLANQLLGPEEAAQYWQQFRKGGAVAEMRSIWAVVRSSRLLSLSK